MSWGRKWVGGRNPPKKEEAARFTAIACASLPQEYRSPTREALYALGNKAFPSRACPLGYEFPARDGCFSYCPLLRLLESAVMLFTPKMIDYPAVRRPLENGFKD